MPHEPGAALFDMLQAIERIQAFVRGVDEAEFAQSETLMWAIYSQIIILGEAAGRLSEDFIYANPQVPWRGIIGMRHRLVHGYDAVNWSRVWLTVQTDVPVLHPEIQALLAA